MADEFWEQLMRALSGAQAICGCPNCSERFKEITALSAQDEVKLVELRSRAEALAKRHQEEISKINNEWMRLLSEWKDKYQLHGYVEVGLQGNKLMGVPR